MDNYINLSAISRTDLGSLNSKRLRKNGNVPAVIYGKGIEPISVAIEEKEATKYYRSGNFTSTAVQLKIDGTEHLVIAKDVQCDPISDLVMHVDFIKLQGKTHKLQIPVKFTGRERSIGVKRGGFFNVIKRTILLECPISAIPSHIEVDISAMAVKDTLLASEVKLPEGCRLASKDIKIASMIGSRGKAASDEAESGDAEGAEEAKEEAKE